MDKKELDEYDWCLIHEALCFALRNDAYFKFFLLDRNGRHKLDKWIEGETNGGHGHELIGFATTLMNKKEREQG